MGLNRLVVLISVTVSFPWFRHARSCTAGIGIWIIIDDLNFPVDSSNLGWHVTRKAEPVGLSFFFQIDDLGGMIDFRPIFHSRNLNHPISFTIIPFN